MTGMLRSISTMSGRSSRYFSSASSPFPASATTSRPGSVARNDTRPARMSGWSSAARILIGRSAGMRMMIRRAAPKPHTQKEVGSRPAGVGCRFVVHAGPVAQTDASLTLIAATTAAPAASAQEPAQTLSQLYHTAWTMRDGAPAGSRGPGPDGGRVSVARAPAPACFASTGSGSSSSSRRQTSPCRPPMFRRSPRRGTVACGSAIASAASA